LRGTQSRRTAFKVTKRKQLLKNTAVSQSHCFIGQSGYFPSIFPKNVFHVTVDSADYRVVGNLEMKIVSWCFFCLSESQPPAAESLKQTPGNIPKEQALQNKGSVSCEVNSIGATGVKLPLPGRTTICIGARRSQSVQS
jgi:hypothetical protein